MNADGTNQTAVPGIPNAFVSTWSPDGTQLMFVARPDSTINTELYVVHVDGTGLTRINQTPDLLEDAPDWGP